MKKQHTFFSDVVNFVICFGVCIPPAFLLYHLLSRCPTANHDDLDEKPVEAQICDIFLNQPVLFVNLVYFVWVDIGFYLIYLLQESTWLIDPHWQLLPVCISLFYFFHPEATTFDGHKHPRAYISLVLVLIWATRLLHNYFRREGYHFGEREDWRYAEMRKAHGKFFIISQFVTVSLVQHGMLVGLTLPLLPTTSVQGADLNVVDVVAIFICVLGIVIGFFADNQLFSYMNMKNKPIILETGLWRYSRHPNHLGEQLWWIGLLVLGVASYGPTNVFSLSSWWPIGFGVLFNHPLDTFATLPLIEQRMRSRKERSQAYQAYQHTTPLCFPHPFLGKKHSN